jgi:ubiquinone/menaquinone biosynthesis C-methylase UbiE
MCADHEGTEVLMTATDTIFAGSIPAIYDQYMVPLIFAPYAHLVAERVKLLRPRRILETAAGTGVVTEAMHRALPEAEIIATDLNAPMLEQAARKLGGSTVHFQPADAQALPLEDASFDLVVCQFGVMFFPDKVRANSEARRVLREGGRYLPVIWDRVEHNLATMTAGRAVAELFPGEGPRFYERIPFRYHDVGIIERDLLAAGFTDIEFETVELRSRAASARDAAIALVQGTPMRSDIEQIDPNMLGRATDVVAEALKQFEGEDGFDAPMSARLVTAIR